MITRSATIRIVVVFAALVGSEFARVECAGDERPVVRVGSKPFTEGAILGELAVQLVEDAGANVIHRRQLVTNVLWNALLQDEIDLYPEYTGTLMREVLAGREIRSVDGLRDVLREQGLRMSAPLGFSNSYALGMKRNLAEQAGNQRDFPTGTTPGASVGIRQ